MATFRHKKGKTPFTRIENSSLQDARLSWKARGLLAYMLSKPDNFKFYLDELVKHAPDGLDSVRAGIKELEALGYVKRYKIKNNGKIVSWEMEVYEIPQLGFPQVESPQLGNPTLITNDLITNDSITNDKIYIDLIQIDGHPYLKFYNEFFKIKFNKPHSKVTPEQLEHIMRNIYELEGYDIDRETFAEAVEEHFDNLPESNNGSILAFIHTFDRAFGVHSVD